MIDGVMSGEWTRTLSSRKRCLIIKEVDAPLTCPYGAAQLRVRGCAMTGMSAVVGAYRRLAAEQHHVDSMIPRVESFGRPSSLWMSTARQS